MKPQARLEVIGPQHVAICRGEARVDLTGPAAERVASWHAHMRTHGEDWAAVYLAGVIDGLGGATAMRARQAIASAEARLAEGRQAMAGAQARQGRGGA
jgi:hypothetical protein